MDLNVVKKFLEDEGFRPDIGEDGDILFKYEGGAYFIEKDLNDENFIRLIYPNFWPIENDVELQHAIHWAGEVTKRIKVAKIYVDENNVWGTVELFIPNEKAFISVFDRCMPALRGAVQEFAKLMRANKG